ncbi:hypothetical protein FQZ97_1211140 [compost metagenome]
MIQYSDRTNSTVSAKCSTIRSANHAQSGCRKWKPRKATLPMMSISTMARATPSLAAIGAASGAATIDASPATAVLAPIRLAE